MLETVKGPRGGYRLARPAAEITVLDVVEAIDGDEPAFRCTEIRRRGPTAVPAREYAGLCGIHRAFLRADDVWRAELRATTIADLVGVAVKDAPPAALEKALRWLAATVRSDVAPSRPRRSASWRLPARGRLPWLALLRRAFAACASWSSCSSEETTTSHR